MFLPLLTGSSSRSKCMWPSPRDPDGLVGCGGGERIPIPKNPELRCQLLQGHFFHGDRPFGFWWDAVGRITFLGVVEGPNTPTVSPGCSHSQAGNEDFWKVGLGREEREGKRESSCRWAVLASADTAGNLAILEGYPGTWGRRGLCHTEAVRPRLRGSLEGTPWDWAGPKSRPDPERLLKSCTACYTVASAVLQETRAEPVSLLGQERRQRHESVINLTSSVIHTNEEVGQPCPKSFTVRKGGSFSFYPPPTPIPLNHSGTQPAACSDTQRSGYLDFTDKNFIPSAIFQLCYLPSRAIMCL